VRKSRWGRGPIQNPHPQNRRVRHPRLPPPHQHSALPACYPGLDFYSKLAFSLPRTSVIESRRVFSHCILIVVFFPLSVGNSRYCYANSFAFIKTVDLSQASACSSAKENCPQRRKLFGEQFTDSKRLCKQPEYQRASIQCEYRPASPCTSVSWASPRRTGTASAASP
jgi:hypothetical protein